MKSKTQSKDLKEKTVSRAPTTMTQALSRSGKKLEPATRHLMESRFGFDFGNVRVHDDKTAQNSARALNAAAYTVGRHIAFGPGQYNPRTQDGREILAHELTHVVQQRGRSEDPALSGIQLAPTRSPDEDTAHKNAFHLVSGKPILKIEPTPQSGILQSLSLGERVARFFGGGTFTGQELQDYLRFLDDNNRIEDAYDSDNKAREVVERWERGDSLYILTERRKTLLIEEMISGFTGDDDERAILKLLGGATDTELTAIMSGVGKSRLEKEFHGKERAKLDQLLTGRQGGTDRRIEEGESDRAEEVFPAETVLALQRRFTSNAESANRLNCIMIIRELAPQLFGLDPKVAESVARQLGALQEKDVKMTEFGRVLSELGLASHQAKIRFNNGNGNREPTAMQGSAWDTIMGMIGGVQGWHIFGMAPFDGYHSVTVLVDNRPDGPRVYWADQWRIDPGEEYDQPNNFQQTFGSVSGFRRYEKAGFDGFITHYTQTRWNSVHSADSDCAKSATEKGRNWDRVCRYAATLHIWKFRSRLPESSESQ